MQQIFLFRSIWFINMLKITIIEKIWFGVLTCAKYELLTSVSFNKPVVWDNKTFFFHVIFYWIVVVEVLFSRTNDLST